MAATARQEKEMKQKFEKMKNDPNSTPLIRLRAYVMTRGVTGIKSISKCFKRLDKDKDGKIGFKEFQDGLHKAGIRVDKSVEKQCFDEIDTGGEGVVDMDEFIVALQPPMSEKRKNLVNQAFEKLDKDGSDVVTAEDLKGVYYPNKHKKYMSGEWTEEQVFEEWLNSFNGPDNFSGEVTRDDFHNYYVGVSASIDSDAYFDLMMRKAWKL